MLKKSLYLILLLSLLSLVSLAQTNDGIDFPEVSKFTLSDSSKIRPLYNEGWTYISTSSDTALIYAHKILELSSAIQYKKGRYLGYNLEGVSYWLIGDYEKALQSFEEALALAKQMKNKRDELSVINNIGIVYTLKGEYFKSHQYYEKAYLESKKIGDYNTLYISLLNIGEALHLNQNYTSALIKLYELEKIFVGNKEAYQVAENPDMTEGLLFNSLTSTLLASGDTTKALTYLDRAVLHNEEKMKQTYVLSDTYLLKGEVALSQRNYKGAKLFFDKALDLSEKGSFSNRSVIYTQLSNYYYQQENWDKAIEYAEKSQNYFKQGYPLHFAADNYRNLSVSYKKNNNYKQANYYIQKYVELKDSLNRIRNSNEFAELEYKIQLKEKVDFNRILEANVKIKEQQLVQRRTALVAVVSGLLLALGIAYYLFKSVRKREQEKVSLDEQVKVRTQKLELANSGLEKKNRQLERFTYTASHDLKEPLRNISGFVGLMEEEMEDHVPPLMEKRFSKIKTSVNRMSTLIQDILSFFKINEMSKVEPEKVNLEEVLKETVEKITTIQGDKAIIKAVDTLPVICTNRKAMFHIFFHAIENGIKFNKSEVPKILVKYKKENGNHCLLFSDNGIGIPKESYEHIFEISSTLHDKKEYEGVGIGLAICHKIINKLGGAIHVLENESSQGITFNFSFPAIKNEK